MKPEPFSSLLELLTKGAILYTCELSLFHLSRRYYIPLRIMKRLGKTARCKGADLVTIVELLTSSGRRAVSIGLSKLFDELIDGLANCLCRLYSLLGR